MRKTKKLTLALSVMFLVTALAACGPQVADPTPAPGTSPGIDLLTPAPGATATPVFGPASTPNPAATATSTFMTPAPSATPTATAQASAETGSMSPETEKSYASVVKKADIVLMGKFTKTLREDNSTRDPSDVKKPSTKYMSGVKVYLFRVDTVLKGSVKLKEVEIALDYSEQNLLDKKPATINPNYMEPNFDDTVILPLFYDPDLKWYINDQGIEPQRFVVRDDQVVFQSVHVDTKSVWDTVKPISLAEFKTVCKNNK